MSVVTCHKGHVVATLDPAGHLTSRAKYRSVSCFGLAGTVVITCGHRLEGDRGSGAMYCHEQVVLALPMAPEPVRT